MDAADIVELFREFGPVSVRRMFGGAAIQRDGLTFGLLSRGVIYLKADAQNAPDFDRERLPPFSYTRNDGHTASMTSFRKMPDRCYDEPDEAAVWARGALAAAIASKAAAPKKAKKAAAAKPKAANKVATSKATAKLRTPAKKKPAKAPAAKKSKARGKK